LTHKVYAGQEVPDEREILKEKEEERKRRQKLNRGMN
jgi:hypothetical protein